MFFKKNNKKIITVGGKKIELEPKPSKLGSIFSRSKSNSFKPSQKDINSESFEKIDINYDKPTDYLRQQKNPSPPKHGLFQFKAAKQPPQQPPQQPTPAAQPQFRPADANPNQGIGVQPQQKRPGVPPLSSSQPGNQNKQPAQGQKNSPFNSYIRKLAIKNRKVEDALKDQQVKGTIYDFIKRMLITSIIISVVLAITIFLLFIRLGLNPAVGLLLAFAIGFAVNQFAFKSFMGFPLKKSKKSSKNVERDILFAARDMIISLRSGMPLYNAIVSVSTGYGDASKEFARITQRVQLGMPLEEAIDQTTAGTKSESFRKIMLQASVSIKAGANVVSSMQSTIDELSEERVIALRKYGQRLNAIAMFYMLFGVILPSMGIAIATILTTFISIFTVNVAILEGAIVGLIFMQVVFLQLIRGSRPVFAM